MREFLVPILGQAGAVVAQFLLTIIIVLGLIGAVWWFIRRYSGVHFGGIGRGRVPRLAIVDAMAVDRRRRLVLVRRDNVEHLLLIGGPSDLVVEGTIQRTRQRTPQQAAAQAAQAAAQRAALQPATEPAPEREPQPARTTADHPAVNAPILPFPMRAPAAAQPAASPRPQLRSVRPPEAPPPPEIEPEPAPQPEPEPEAFVEAEPAAPPAAPSVAPQRRPQMQPARTPAMAQRPQAPPRQAQQRPAPPPPIVVEAPPEEPAELAPEELPPPEPSQDRRPEPAVHPLFAEVMTAEIEPPPIAPVDEPVRPPPASFAEAEREAAEEAGQSALDLGDIEAPATAVGQEETGVAESDPRVGDLEREMARLLDEITTRRTT